MANLSTIFNSGSLYEQLIGQVMSIESQPRLKLKAEQTEQTVYKAILSDFSSKASALDSVLDRFSDPLQKTFLGKAASVGDGAGFGASATDAAANGTHELRVTQLARADARLSQRFDATAAAPVTGPMSFTIHIAQPEGDPVDVEVTYTQGEGQTLGDALGGISAAINDAVAAAEADGRLAEGTGAAASVVRETSDTARLSLRSEATGYANRLTFTDTDGLLGLLQVDRETQQTGMGGGAVHAVGTGAEDSALSAAFTLDGLAMVRDSNTVDDALEGVTLTLTKPTDAASTLTVGADVKGIRGEVEAFVKAYNGLSKFLTSKSAVDAETGTRGVFASDSAVRGLRNGLRSDLARAVDGAGDLRALADLGISTERDGTLTIDAAALEAAIADSPSSVGALFTGDDGLVARLAARIDGLLGASGTIEQRLDGADARIDRIGDQIARWDTRLTRREDSLRAQFTQLQELTMQAQSQQAAIASLFYF